MTMQVRDYIGAMVSHPSDAQAPAQGEEVETQPLPSEPHLDDGPKLELTWDIWDLNNDQLWRHLRLSMWRKPRGRGHTSTRVTLGKYEVPWGQQSG